MAQDQHDIEWKLRINNIAASIEKQISEMDKNRSDINKNQTDIDKSRSETRLTDKKSRWYELTLVIAIFSAAAVFVGTIITITKLYL